MVTNQEIIDWLLSVENCLRNSFVSFVWINSFTRRKYNCIWFCFVFGVYLIFATVCVRNRPNEHAFDSMFVRVWLFNRSVISFCNCNLMCASFGTTWTIWCMWFCVVASGWANERTNKPNERANEQLSVCMHCECRVINGCSKTGKW